MKRALVTRAAHQNQTVCNLLQQHDWQAICVPMIAVQSSPLTAHKQHILNTIESYDYLFFISVNAVNFALQAINGKIERLQNSLCIAVGESTQKALAAAGIAKILMPKQGFNSESVLKLNALQHLKGQSCLIIRGESGREYLATHLQQRAAQVDYLDIYQRYLPEHDCTALVHDIEQQLLTAIMIYSGDTLHNLVQLLSTYKIQLLLLNIPLIVISQRVAVLAKNLGFKKIITADEASDAGMIHALLNGEECG